MNSAVLEPAGINATLIYGYIALAFFLSGILALKSKAAYKFELWVLAFYLFIGSYGKLLTFKIPGISFFEIQPERFLLLTFLVLFLRKLLFSGIRRSSLPGAGSMPSFVLVLLLYVTSVSISQATHLQKIGLAEWVVEVLYLLTFVIIIFAMRLMADREFFKVIGQAIILAAAFSSIISLMQLGHDFYFMRMGELRQAFGRVVRSNGIFYGEYTNAYFLIAGIFWTLITLRSRTWKLILVGLLCAGIISTFHRMSWLILSLSLVIYFSQIRRPAFDRLLLASLSGAAALLLIAIFFYRDIVNSSLVRDRLSDSIDGRRGYWTMVADHIGEKPLFGFGDMDNEVYYTNMLKITGDRDRATASTGDIHNGYLQAAFVFGIPSFIFFAGFVILAVLYFMNLVKYHDFFAIPFLFALLYCLANLTNNFLFDKPLAIICAIHFGVGLGSRYLGEYFPALHPAKVPSHSVEPEKYPDREDH